MKLYHKTATTKVERFDGSEEMCDKYGIEAVEGDYAEDYGMPEAGPAPYFRYFMPSGYNELYVGDQIATGVNGEHWAIADDVFKKTYAELPVIPKYVADYIDMLKNNSDVVTASIGALEYGWGEIELINWIDENGDTFARAWLDGYQTEEDK